MKKPILFLALVIATLIAIQPVSATTIISPVTDYGNGVLYISNSHAVISSGWDTKYQSVGEALSQYLADHPSLHIAQFVSDNGGYGNSYGYFIILENKNQSFCPSMPVIGV